MCDGDRKMDTVNKVEGVFAIINYRIGKKRIREYHNEINKVSK